MSGDSLNNQFFITVYFIVSGNCLQLVQYSDSQGQQIQTTVPRGVELSLSIDELEGVFVAGPVQMDVRETSSLPPPLTAYPRQLGCKAAAYVPILQKGKLRGLVLIGAREGQEFNEDIVDAFEGTIRLTTNALELSDSSTQPLNERQAAELKSINLLAANTTNVDDLRSFYRLIHDQIRSVMGN